MRTEKFVTFVLVALFVAGCAGGDDAATAPGGASCGVLDGPEPPDDICALRDSDESLECVQTPWTYRRVRNGLSLRIECKAVGMFSTGANTLGVIMYPAADVQTYDMAKDWKHWPMAECDVEPTVDSYAVPSNGVPYERKKISASMWVFDGSVSLSTDAPELAPATTFADCQQVGPTPHTRP